MTIIIVLSMVFMITSITYFVYDNMRMKKEAMHKAHVMHTTMHEHTEYIIALGKAVHGR